MREIWRWLDTGDHPGAWNMAVDEAIMAQVAGGLVPPTIRVYGWNPPALSLGYFQNRDREVDLAGCARKGFDCVRRPTGGRAVLHDREVTYAFIAPENHPLIPTGVIASYQVITRGILEGLRSLGVDAQMVTPSKPESKEESTDFGTGTTAACFDAPSWYEVVVSGKKLVGSAQVRRYGAVLQHGSILLNLSVDDLFATLKFRSPALRERAERLFTQKATSLLAVLGREVFPSELKEALRDGWQKALGIELTVGRLTPAELEQAAQLAREKYASEAWNGQRRYPAPSINQAQHKPGVLTLGFLGPKGTFSEQAALDYLGEHDLQRELVPYSTLSGLISALEDGTLHEAVVPAENSIEGSVNLTLDLLIQGTDLSIIGEVVIPVHHHLLVRPGTEISRIETVYSHPQALAQCRRFLKAALPGAREISTSSTAGAAEMVSKENHDHPAAAIGTAHAGQLWGLEIAAREIQDVPDNFTRFLVLAGGSIQERKRDGRRFKTSIAFSTLTDRPGGLYEVLGEFANRGVNLTRIESRPARRMLGEYLFFLDLAGHQDDPSVRESLDAIRPKTSFFRNFGSYPEAAFKG